MSELYDIVKRILASSTKEEAESILYGREGIQINSTEYYQNIISNFIRKKDIVLPKDSNGNIIYDIDENIQDIWDIVFISQYIQEQWKKEKKELEKEKINLNRNIKLEKDPIILEQLNNRKAEIIKLEDMINQYFQHLEKISELNKINIQTSINIDENKYKNELLELKKAIRIMQKIRDSFEHRNNSLNIDKKITIINEKNKFKITIPTEYLEGFTKGRIIVEEQDKYLIEITSNITYPLLEELNYDPKKLESFFYNVDPSYLSFLLEHCNYDINKLYKLSAKIFEHEKATKYFLKNKFNIEYINKLTSAAFLRPEYAVKLHNAGIDIAKLPRYAFYQFNITIELHNAGIDITKMSESMIAKPLNAIKLYNTGIDITKLSHGAFENPNNAIKLHNANIDIIELPDGAFYDQSVEGAIKLHNAGIDITKLSHIAFENPNNAIKLYNAGIDITKLQDGAYHDRTVEGVIKLYNAGIDITKLQDGAYRDRTAEGAIKLYNAGIDITQLSYNAFVNPNNAIKLYNAGIDITKLSHSAFENPNNAIKLHNAGIDISKPLLNSILPIKLFDDQSVENAIKLHNAGVDISKMPKKLFEFYLFRPNIAISDIKLLNIKYLLEIVKYDYERLNQFPIEFFTCNIEVLEEMLSKYNYNLCRSIFGIDNPKIISLLIYMNNVYGNYSKEMSKDISINPINIIENSLNDTYKYKNNIINKNINSNSYVNQFIIDEKEVKNNPNIMQFNYINSGFHKNANGEYFNPNIDEYDDDYNPNNDPLFMPKRNIEQIKEYIITKLRNSSAHFRFKLVKDKDGNILEDKIYLYDEDNNGNNFNIIMNINDALDITRKVELGIKGLNNNEEINNNKKSK